MAFFSSDTYPDWQGHLLVASLKFNYLLLCEVADDTVKGDQILFKGIGRVWNIKQGPDGYIYVATERNGILRIVPEGT